MTRFVIARVVFACSACGDVACRHAHVRPLVELPAMQPGDSVRVTMTADGTFDVVPLCADDFLNTDADDGCLYDRHGERVWSGGGLLVRLDAPEQENDR